MDDSGLTFDELFASVRNLARRGALSDWKWLTGRGARPLLLTAMGDLFLHRPPGLLRRSGVFLLDTYEGTFEQVAPDYETLKELLERDDLVSRWLRPVLVKQLKDCQLVLEEGQCYSPKVLPVLGGKMDTANFAATDWEVHLSITGQIHRQVKDLPPGTPIKGFTIG